MLPKAAGTAQVWLSNWFAFVAVAAVPPMLRLPAVPVSPVPGPENWEVAATVVPVIAAGVVLPKAAGTAQVEP